MVSNGQMNTEEEKQRNLQEKVDAGDEAKKAQDLERAKIEQTWKKFGKAIYLADGTGAEFRDFTGMPDLNLYNLTMGAASSIPGVSFTDAASGAFAAVQDVGTAFVTQMATNIRKNAKLDKNDASQDQPEQLANHEVDEVASPGATPAVKNTAGRFTKSGTSIA